VSYIRPNPPIAENSLPLEWEHANDVDFTDEDEGVLHEILPICEEIFAEWNLFVNESKTEFVRCFLAEKNDVNKKGEPLRSHEPWRKCISLGSRH
jgi:hypothetical protein